MCGVFGVRSGERDVARLTYFGLFALQHRGQESAGIAVSDGGRLTVAPRHGPRRARVRRGEALGAARRGRDRPHALLDDGRRHWSNAQPLVHHGAARTVALGHNGNLDDPTRCATSCSPTGVRLGSTSDTEVIAALLARDPAPLPEAVAATMRRLRAPTRSSRSRTERSSPSATRTASGP